MLSSVCCNLGRVAELETSIKSLETQLQEQEEEANNIITQWQDAYSASDERCSQLEEGLLKATEEKRTILRDLESSQKDKEQLEVEKMSLEARIVVLEDLQNEEQDQTVRRESSQNEIEELLTKLKAMEDELNEARKTLARDEDVVSQREGEFV